MSDEFNFDISPKDLIEMRKIAQETVAASNKKRLEDMFEPHEVMFLTELGKSLAVLGVAYDFDVAKEKVLLILPLSALGHDAIPIRFILQFCNGDNNVNPEGFAHALVAGMISPEFFCLWKEEDENDDDD